MSDDRTIIERSQALNRYLTGSEATFDEMALGFAKQGLEERTAQLDALDAERPRSLRDAATALTLKRKLVGVHEALRKAGR